MDDLQDGHVWLGSGGTPGKHGIGIVLHARWSSYIKAWRPWTERIGFVDICRGKFCMRIIAAYMPHTGYSDKVVQEVYDQLNQIIDDGRKL
eukprot:2856637-Karenia_brevis.AAC.1